MGIDANKGSKHNASGFMITHNCFHKNDWLSLNIAKEISLVENDAKFDYRKFSHILRTKNFVKVGPVLSSQREVNLTECSCLWRVPKVLD